MTNGLDRLYKALAAFEDEESDPTETLMKQLAGESNCNDIRSTWKRKTEGKNGGGIFETGSGLYELELNDDGTTKRLRRLE